MEYYGFTTIFFPYELKCQQPGCSGKQLIVQAESAGWTVGYIIPYDASHPGVGKCGLCQSYQMKVMNAPEPPPVPTPEGWVKIPTE